MPFAPSKISRKYGCKPGTQDHRAAAHLIYATVHTPDHFSFRRQMLPAFDQGQTSSCTAHGWAAATWRDQCLFIPHKPFMPSRLFIYNQERIIEGDLDQDQGAQVATGAKVLHTLGVCPEADFPFDASSLLTKPDAAVVEEAGKTRMSTVARVQLTSSQVEAAIASGVGVVFGIILYESFESDAVAKTGLVPMPSSSESAVGGHCMFATGYDRVTRLIEVRNSWGPEWGSGGYAYIPYNYFFDPSQTSDLWQGTRIVSSLQATLRPATLV